MTIRINDEYRVLINLYKREGLDLSLFEKRTAAVIINGSRILHLNTVEGVSIEGSEAEDGVTVEVKIADGVKLPFPIHLCMGFLRNEGFQKVIFNINVGADAEVRFLSHCIFPYAKNFTHEAIARIKVGKNAIVTYDDTHVHGEGVRMISKSDVEVLDGGRYIGRFSLTKHRAKELKFETNVKLGNYSSAEISSKVKAVKDDNVEMKEVLSLDGSYSRGRIKSIVIASDEARVNVINEVYGFGEYSKGHVECNEIVRGKADVQTVPLLRVKSETAELTHEAAIGRINEAQLVQLMAKGLTEEEAAELIIRGLLRGF